VLFSQLGLDEATGGDDVQPDGSDAVTHGGGGTIGCGA